MNIFPIILPLILLVTLGYATARFRWVSQETTKELSKITFNVLIPLYLFHHIATADIKNNLSTDVFLSFYGIVALTYIISCGLFYLAKGDGRYKETNAGVFALAGSYSNTIIVGLPILVGVLDDSVAAIVFLIISFHSAMLFILTSIISQTAQHAQLNLGKLFKSTLFNPLLIGIFSGLLFNLLNIKFSDWISASFELLTKPALTFALLILGASLNQFRIKSRINLVVVASLIKLCILPLLVFLATTYVFHLSEELTLILVILTACPTGVNAYLVAVQQNSGQAVLAGTVVVSTIASAVTLPAWLYYLT